MVLSGVSRLSAPEQVQMQVENGSAPVGKSLRSLGFELSLPYLFLCLSGNMVLHSLKRILGLTSKACITQN